MPLDRSAIRVALLHLCGAPDDGEERSNEAVVIEAKENHSLTINLSEFSSIVKAEYGHGDSWIDTTENVEQWVLAGQPFLVNNDTCGGDPAPGKRKVLRVSYLPACVSQSRLVTAAGRLTCLNPTAFRDFRQSLGLSDEDYFKSLTSDELDGTGGPEASGKSGESFLYTRDGSFVLKTSTEFEMGNLLSMLPQYSSHLAAHSDSLLTRYLGAYRLISEDESDDILFLVMNNVFHGSVVHVRYDLKGTTEDRSVKEVEGACLKDNNFAPITMHAGDEMVELLHATIAADTAFLEGRGIMDYSMLVGVQYLDLDGDKQMCDRKLNSSLMGGFEGSLVQGVAESAARRECVFHIGMIDMLISYNYKKRIAHFFKANTIKYFSEIDTEPPDVYAERFRQYFRRKIRLSREEVRISLLPVCSIHVLVHADAAGNGRDVWNGLESMKKIGTLCVGDAVCFAATGRNQFANGVARIVHPYVGWVVTRVGEGQQLFRSRPEEGLVEWKYDPPQSKPLNIRALPSFTAARTGDRIQPGEVFDVFSTVFGDDGVRYLCLADGRGWVFDAAPGFGLLCSRVDGQAPPGYQPGMLREEGTGTAGEPAQPAQLLNLDGFPGWCQSNLRGGAAFVTGWSRGAGRWYDEDALRELEAGGCETIVWDGRPAGVPSAEGEKPTGFPVLVQEFLRGPGDKRIAVAFVQRGDVGKFQTCCREILHEFPSRIVLVSLDVDSCADELGEELSRVDGFPEFAQKRFVVQRTAMRAMCSAMGSGARLHAVVLGGGGVVSRLVEASLAEGANAVEGAAVEWRVFALSRGGEERFPVAMDLVAANPGISSCEGKDPTWLDDLSGREERRFVGAFSAAAHAAARAVRDAAWFGDDDDGLPDEPSVPLENLGGLLLNLGHLLSDRGLAALQAAKFDLPAASGDQEGGDPWLSESACRAVWWGCGDLWTPVLSGATPLAEVFILVQPSSGGGLAKNWLELPTSIRAYDFDLTGDAGIVACHAFIKIVNMRDGSPGDKHGFRSLAERCRERSSSAGPVRVIVAGGDGAVNWAIDEIQRHAVDTQQIALGVCPYGTGNDLSRVLGWGDSSPIESPQTDRHETRMLVSRWLGASITPLDLWSLSVSTHAGGSFSVARSNGSEGLDQEDIARLQVRDAAGGGKQLTRSFVNYFSFGVVAQMGFQFDKQRGDSTAENKAKYAWVGLQKMFEEVTEAAETATINEVVEDIADADQTFFRTGPGAPMQMAPTEPVAAVIFLNIPSMAAGADIWEWSSEASTLGSKRFLRQRQDFGDGLMEVMTYRSASDFSREQLGPLMCGTGRRLHSGAGPFRTIFRPVLNLDGSGDRMYMQADGEFFAVDGPQDVVIERAAGGGLLALVDKTTPFAPKPRGGSGGGSGQASNDRPVSEFAVGTVCVATTALQVRSLEALDSPPVAKIAKQAEMEVLVVGVGPTGRRIRVRYAGPGGSGSGWVSVVAGDGRRVIEPKERSLADEVLKDLSAEAAAIGSEAAALFRGAWSAWGGGGSTWGGGAPSPKASSPKAAASSKASSPKAAASSSPKAAGAPGAKAPSPKASSPKAATSSRGDKVDSPPSVVSEGSHGGRGSAEDEDELFFSFTEAEFDDVTKGVRLRREFSGRVMPPSFTEQAPALKLPKNPPVNANLMSNYRWLEEIFALVTQGRAQGSSRDTVRQMTATPLFAVAGTCPNTMAPLQAVTFFRLEDGKVDLWWVKPTKSDTSRLERETLNLQKSGRHKNDAGARARGLYTPLAERYEGGGKVDGDFTFGIDAATGRAFIDDLVAPGRDRMLLYFVWQEYWSGVWDRKKFIAGRLCYQRSVSSAAEGHGFFTRQYKITDGEMYIAPKEEEEALPALFPPDSAQSMYDMQQ